MNWVILEDKISEAGERSRVGFGNHPQERAKELAYRFRLSDDDGIVYYVGRCDELEFDALDWAMADAGCTGMEYFSHGKGWAVL